MDNSTSTGTTNCKQQILERIVKKGGLRASVDANCCECIFDEKEPGTWRNQVKNCTVCSCPLYAHRPIPTSVSKTEITKH